MILSILAPWNMNTENTTRDEWLFQMNGYIIVNLQPDNTIKYSP